jgi:hypothetical protein
MWLFQDFLDQSKQLNQTPSRSLPAYHPPICTLKRARRNAAQAV